MSSATGVTIEVFAEEVDKIRPQVAPDKFRNFTADAFPSSTLPAMELTAAAYAVSDRIGQEVALAVRHALFEQGADVGDPDVLASIATTHDVVWPPDPDHFRVTANRDVFTSFIDTIVGPA